jgi:hypothetical protein
VEYARASTSRGFDSTEDRRMSRKSKQSRNTDKRFTEIKVPRCAVKGSTDSAKKNEFPKMHFIALITPLLSDLEHILVST